MDLKQTYSGFMRIAVEEATRNTSEAVMAAHCSTVEAYEARIAELEAKIAQLSHNDGKAIIAIQDEKQAVLKRASEIEDQPCGKMVRLNADIDECLHIEFRTHCLQNGLTVKQMLPAVLENYLKK